MRSSTLRSAAAAIALVLAPGGLARAGNVCKASALAAGQACKNEGVGAYWTAVANCLNLSSNDATQACKKAANDAVREARADCADRVDARRDLCARLGKGPYDPVIDPATFVSPAETASHPNAYFPLIPGTVWVYEGGGETDTVTVTGDTRVIAGVTTIVVHDVVADATDTVTEDTEDYYAQQSDGTVWYFGEASQQLAEGHLVGIEGSFIAGVDGAKPGIIMKAAPAVGDVYRQEFALGVAEDAAEVLNVTGSETVPATSCSGTCVVTHEFSPLEPDANEQKFYAPGVGTILEIDVAEGGTRLELVSVTHH